MDGKIELFTLLFNLKNMKIGILLSGCGVYDGAEIHEAVFSLLAVEEEGHEPVCISINKTQHHVINHLNGEEMQENRNMLIESARIARGEVIEINNVESIDALIIPGGFGSAKNFTKWAFSGPDGMILEEVKNLILKLNSEKKPIVALCVSPVVIAKAMQESATTPCLTIGSSKEKSPYDINSFIEGLNKTGANTSMKNINEIEIDYKNKIITAPCYMMEASIKDIRTNIQNAIKAIKELI